MTMGRMQEDFLLLRPGAPFLASFARSGDFRPSALASDLTGRNLYASIRALFSRIQQLPRFFVARMHASLIMRADHDRALPHQPLRRKDVPDVLPQHIDSEVVDLLDGIFLQLPVRQMAV